MRAGRKPPTGCDPISNGKVAPGRSSGNGKERNVQKEAGTLRGTHTTVERDSKAESRWGEWMQSRGRAAWLSLEAEPWPWQLVGAHAGCWRTLHVMALLRRWMLALSAVAACGCGCRLQLLAAAARTENKKERHHREGAPPGACMGACRRCPSLSSSSSKCR